MTEFKRGQKILVDIEFIRSKPEKWVEATFLRVVNQDLILVEFRDVIYAYPRKLIKEVK